MRKSMDSAGKSVYANKVVMEQLAPLRSLCNSQEAIYRPIYNMAHLMKLWEKIISLHRVILVTHGKFFDFGLASDGKLVRNPQSDDILSHLTQLLHTKKVTKSHKNRYPTYVKCI